MLQKCLIRQKPERRLSATRMNFYFILVLALLSQLCGRLRQNKIHPSRRWPTLQFLLCLILDLSRLVYYVFVNCSNYNFSGDGFSTLTASMCGAPLSARGNVDWMRKLAFRYRRIRDVYAVNCTNVAGNRAVVIFWQAPQAPTVWVKKSPPPLIFVTFSPNSWEFLVQILYAYYTFLSKLNFYSVICNFDEVMLY